MEQHESLSIQIIDFGGNIVDTKIIPLDGQFSEDTENTNMLLNPSFCREFCEAINASPIFCYDPTYMSHYHLSCAVMDRLDPCIEKLNTYGE